MLFKTGVVQGSAIFLPPCPLCPSVPSPPLPSARMSLPSLLGVELGFSVLLDDTGLFYKVVVPVHTLPSCVLSVCFVPFLNSIETLVQ